MDMEQNGGESIGYFVILNYDLDIEFLAATKQLLVPLCFFHNVPLILSS